MRVTRHLVERQDADKKRDDHALAYKNNTSIFKPGDNDNQAR